MDERDWRFGAAGGVRVRAANPSFCFLFVAFCVLLFVCVRCWGRGRADGRSALASFVDPFVGVGAADYGRPPCCGLCRL